MRKNTVLLRLASILLALIILSGCSVKQVNRNLEMTETKLIVDSIGREVEVPDSPMRVACLFTNTGHIMSMLGAGDKIVAVSNGLKRDKLLHEIQPSIADAVLVKLGGDVNFEELLKCNIDLMIMPSDMYQDDALIKQLNKYGIPFIVTKFDSIEDQQELVTMLGVVFNAEDEADRYNTMYNNIIKEVEEVLGNIQESDKHLIYHSLNEATNTVPSGSLPSEWMKLAGGIEVSLNNGLVQDNEKYYASLEQIVYWNPEYIFCNEDGVDQYILEKDQWSMIDAVKNNNVYIMPTGISRWGHTTSIETPLAMIWTAKTMYSDLCKGIDLKQYTFEFYSELFEYKLTDEQYNSIIAGRGMRLEKDLTD